MIAFLTGKVAGLAANFALIEVSGVGYRLEMTSRSLAALPPKGEQVMVHTHLQVRDDGLTLFGFMGVDEREAFEALLTVSGVGPKVALSALSALSPDELIRAVETADVAVISGVSGVGKKTAQRIIVDLAGRFSRASGSEGGASAGSSVPAETRDALLAMGFTASEAEVALKGSPPTADVQEALRYALGRLGRRA
jgi:Holliday junction DNA helicase RuvA